MASTKCKYQFVTLLGLLVVALSLSAQQDSLRFTSFSKGRSLVALSGSINSAVDNKTSPLSNVNNVYNNYKIDARLAKIVARNLSLGLYFSTSKYSSEQFVKTDTEVLTIGPHFAYYFTQDQPGGLFINSSFMFVNYFERSVFTALTPPLDEFATGKGFAFLLGFGYTYVVFDRVGLEVSMNYRQARIYGEVENNLYNTKSSEKFNRIDLFFNFGFIVLFDQVKK